MVTEVITAHAVATAAAVSNYIADWACDIGIAKFKDRCDKRRLNKSVMAFIQRNQKYHELGTMSQEFDIEALINYFRMDFTEVVMRRCFEVSPKARGCARDELVNAAVGYANANNIDAIDRVCYFVSVSIDIIRDFYKKKIDYSQWILASEIVDEVGKGIKASEESIRVNTNKCTEAIIDAVEANRSVTNEVMEKIATIEAYQNNPYSLSNIALLANKREYGKIQELMNNTFEEINSTHILRDYYKTEFRNGKLASIPRTREAVEKYPPRFVCKGFGVVGGRKIATLDQSVVDYANRHQLKIYLTATEVEKYLGEIKDPYSGESEEMIGRTFIIEPEPFPPAFPCSISVDDTVYYEYIELRTKEILDDDTYVVTNDEQKNTHIHVELRFNRNDPSMHVTYTMGITNGTHVELLNYAKMMRAASKGGRIEVKHLGLGKQFMAGKLNQFECPTGFASIDEEIDFLERICDIEKYYSVVINIPNSIREDELFPVMYTSELIRGGTYESDWGEVVLSGRVDDGLRAIVDVSDEKEEEFCITGRLSYDIWGTTMKLNIHRVYKSAKIKALNKLKVKLSVLDNNDPIEITYISGTEKVFVDQLLTPELAEQFPNPKITE